MSKSKRRSTYDIDKINIEYNNKKRAKDYKEQFEKVADYEKKWKNSKTDSER